MIDHLALVRNEIIQILRSYTNKNGPLKGPMIWLGLRKHASKKFKIWIAKRYGLIKYSLYACWDNKKGMWQEKPDFRLDFIGHDRDSILWKKDDPDRALAIEITNKILEALAPVAESQDKTRVNIWCEPGQYYVEILEM